VGGLLLELAPLFDHGGTTFGHPPSRLRTRIFDALGLLLLATVVFEKDAAGALVELIRVLLALLWRHSAQRQTGGREPEYIRGNAARRRPWAAERAHVGGSPRRTKPAACSQTDHEKGGESADTPPAAARHQCPLCRGSVAVDGPARSAPAEIRGAIQRDKGIAIAFTSIRHALGQLEERSLAEKVGADIKAWRYRSSG
jgi:hypothetical protein